MSNYVNNHMILLMYFKICHLWWIMWSIRKIQVPQTSPNNHLPLPAIISLAQCNHSLSLLDAGQFSHQICLKTCENHPTISMLHLKFFLQQYKPSRGYPSKLSAADTHHVQQLIRSWKAGNAAQVAKVLVDIKNQPLTSCTIDFNLRWADLKAVQKKKSHFSASGIGECSWSLLLHIKVQLYRTGNWWKYHMRPMLTILGQVVG